MCIGVLCSNNLRFKFEEKCLNRLVEFRSAAICMCSSTGTRDVIYYINFFTNTNGSTSPKFSKILIHNLVPILVPNRCTVEI